MRRGELCGLKWNDIDFQGNSLEVCRTVLYTAEDGIYIDSPKTLKSFRTISIPKELTNILIEYKQWLMQSDSNMGEYVFSQRDGIKPIHPDSINSFFKRFQAKNQLFDINPHAFRHTMASVLLAGGIDFVTVSNRLGHKKVSTTLDIYSHVMVKLDTACSDFISGRLL